MEPEGKTKLSLRIRPQVVEEALRWLKANNTYYKDVTISEDNLNFYRQQEEKDIDFPTMKYAFQPKETRLDAEVPVDEKARILESELGHDFPEDDSLMSSKLASKTVDQFIKEAVKGKDKEDNVPKLKWPTRSKKPLSEREPGFFSMAYPKLFPTGKGDFNQINWQSRIPPSFYAWANHCLNWHDGRFRKDPDFM